MSSRQQTYLLLVSLKALDVTHLAFRQDLHCLVSGWLQGLIHNVSDTLSDGLDSSLVIGMGAVGEDNHINTTGRVTDHGCPGIAAMAKGLTRGVVALDPGVAGIQIKAECAPV